LAESSVVSTQTPPQSIVPAGQTHRPETHEPPIGQVLPHVPQFALSAERSAHDVPQSTVPIGQTHAPAVQVAVGGQALPHAPQLARSVWNVAGSVQMPAQQTPLAQSAVSSQGPPSWDGPAAQMPFRQTPEQHAALLPHDCPAFLQHESQITV
jgi:hypothetical protein